MSRWNRDITFVLVEADVQLGDVVLVSPLMFIATVNPIKYQFAQYVFSDCDNVFVLNQLN